MFNIFRIRPGSYFRLPILKFLPRIFTSHKRIMEDTSPITLQQAAANIVYADFLSHVGASWDCTQEELIKFVHYFDRAFTRVPRSDFPWVSLFRESIPVMAEVPLSHLPKAVYMTSMEWISGCSTQAAESFVAWALDTVLDDLATPPDYEGSQSGGRRTQVGVFSVLAMVLRQKPNALIDVLYWKMDKYQVQDGCLVIAWMIVQASRGKLCVGLYLWARHILPLVEQSACSNPQTMDLIVGLIKWILNTPDNHSMLLEETVENGERLVPLSALDILLRVAFPASSLETSVTIILKGAYPGLKRVALEGLPRTPEAMKQVSKELLPLALKAAGKGIPRVSEESTMLVNWCLIKNADCYKMWNTVYMDNIEASALVLRDLVTEWSILSVRQSSVDALRETLNSFRLKNKLSLDVRVDAHRAHYRDADESCKILLARLSRGHELQQWMVYLLAFVVGMIIGCYMFCTVGTSCDHCSSNPK